MIGKGVRMASKQLSRLGRLARHASVALALSASGALAQSDTSQDVKLGVADLGVVVAAYVDGAVELRQFILACAPADAVHWREGAELILATMRRAGLPGDQVASLEARLASGADGAAAYDCQGDVAKARLAYDPPADWVEFHKASLAHIGVEIVMSDNQPDARLDAIRAAVAGHIPEQSRMLNCMALVETRMFPIAYADWQGLVDGAAGAIAAAGYDAETVASVVDPARSANLMKPVTDRQAAIADCIGETGWMTRFATFNWYVLKGDVEKAIGTSP